MVFQRASRTSYALIANRPAAPNSSSPSRVGSGKARMSTRRLLQAKPFNSCQPITATMINHRTGSVRRYSTCHCTASTPQTQPTKKKNNNKKNKTKKEKQRKTQETTVID